LKMKRIVIILLLLTACQKNEKNYISAFILRSVGTPWLYPEYYKEVYIYNKNGFPEVPTVQINDTNLPLYDYHENWYRFIECRKLDIDREYKMVVKTPQGMVFGEVYLPGEYEILSPDSTYILKRDSSLKISWRKAYGAKWYWLDLTIEYDYEDTLGEWDDYEFWMDTILFDTFCIYEANRFFPPDIDTILEGEGVINIWALDGPPILPGSLGNIKGEGYGFFHCAYQPPERYFFVGTTPKERRIKSKGKEKLERLYRFQRDGIYR
ncbi:MAG: hypothetical protein ABIK84_06385, partial [candidate division WOR-3 bacterium]